MIVKSLPIPNSPLVKTMASGELLKLFEKATTSPGKEISMHIPPTSRHRCPRHLNVVRISGLRIEAR